MFILYRDMMIPWKERGEGRERKERDIHI